MELEKAPFNLHEIVERCHSVLLPSISDKGLDMEVDNASLQLLTGKKIIGDSVRLYQALMNLMSNAIKFTSTGTVRLLVDIKSLEKNTAVIYFEVKDSGIGMTQEQASKVFDPFIQADSSTTRNYGGTGLGLSITNNIIEMMGGTLNLKSEINVGSTFSFQIEFDVIDSFADTSEDSNRTLEKPRFDGLILVCDDNLMNQRVAIDHLENIGFRVVVADNGKIGVQKVHERVQAGEKPFDLIFMDMFMPVMDGIEAATRILEMETGTPIVAMTANIMPSELERYRKHGMPHCLGKPFTSQDLWRMLLKYLKPISSETVNAEEFAQSDDKLSHSMRINFIKNNQNIFEEIDTAIVGGDIKAAHRMAHTLKGNAGQIGEARLQKAAETLEELLKDGASPVSGGSMKNLKAELKPVLKKLKPLLEEELKSRGKNPSLNNEQAFELFARLEPMLKKSDTGCLSLCEEIRAIATGKAGELAEQIELFDFEQAYLTLENLKAEMENNES
jgi:CheY-like chemotaxis protein/two-component sensor histidine kinase